MRIMINFESLKPDTPYQYQRHFYVYDRFWLLCDLVYLHCLSFTIDSKLHLSLKREKAELKELL